MPGRFRKRQLFRRFGGRIEQTMKGCLRHPDQLAQLDRGEVSALSSFIRSVSAQSEQRARLRHLINEAFVLMPIAHVTLLFVRSPNISAPFVPTKQEELWTITINTFSLVLK